MISDSQENPSELQSKIKEFQLDLISPELRHGQSTSCNRKNTSNMPKFENAAHLRGLERCFAFWKLASVFINLFICTTPKSPKEDPGTSTHDPHKKRLFHFLQLFTTSASTVIGHDCTGDMPLPLKYVLYLCIDRRGYSVSSAVC